MSFLCQILKPQCVVIDINYSRWYPYNRSGLMYSSDEFETNEVNDSKGNGLKDFYGNNKILIWILVAVIIIAGFVLLFRKSGSSKSYSVSIKPDGTIVVAPGANYQLEGRLNDEKATFVWTSSDNSIATVDNSGNITGVNYGQAIITATINKNNKKYEAKKSIVVADGNKDVQVTSVNVANESVTMKVNDTSTIILEITPANGYVFSKKFTSSNENVAKVSSTGVIESVSVGQATITVDINGNLKKTIKVVVSDGTSTTPSTDSKDTPKTDDSSKAVAVTDLQLAVTGLYFEVGRSQSIAPVVVPGNATDKTITCTSGNSAIVKVELESDKMSCLATAVASGSTTITIKSNSSGISKSIIAIVR